MEQLKSKYKESFNDKSGILKAFEDQYAAIKREYDTVVSSDLLQKWPEKDIYNEGWNVFGLRFQNSDMAPAHAICPVLSGITKKYSSVIHTIGFSVLNPGTIISPHVGYTSEVLRCHMGISVPEGDCCLKVGGVTRKWKNGEAFIFDDTITHEAWNKTSEIRVVMLVDLVKKNFM